MKFLSQYVKAVQTAILNKYGVFFAFSTKQFEESAVKGVKYTNMGNGGICPTEHVKNYINDLHECYMAGIQQDLAENGKWKIIKRELYNHEAFYTSDLDQTVSALEPYKITREEIQKVYNAEYVTAIELCG